MPIIDYLLVTLRLCCLMLYPHALFRNLYGLPWYRQTLMTALDADKLPVTGQTVLEIGCAGGDFSADIAKMGGKVSGLDRSATMIRQAKARLAQADFLVADASAIPFRDSTFDRVLGCSLLNVVSDPASVLLEMKRVCKNGGMLAFQVPLAQHSTQAVKTWIRQHHYTPEEAGALMLWHRLANKIPEALIQDWLNQAGLAESPRNTLYLLGGMVLCLQISVEK